MWNPWGNGGAASGVATGLPVGTTVALHQYMGKKWEKIATVKTDKRGRYSARLSSPSAGILRVRATASAKKLSRRVRRRP